MGADIGPSIHTLLLILILVLILAFLLYVRDAWTTVRGVGYQVARSFRRVLPRLTHHECKTLKYPDRLHRSLLLGEHGDNFNGIMAPFLGKCIISAYNLCCGYESRLPAYAEVIRNFGRAGYLIKITESGRPSYVIVFRGTLDGEDVIADLDIAQVPFSDRSTSDQPVMVHRGFYGIWISLRNEIRSTIDREKIAGSVIYVTGHSLGGALAALTALDLASSGHRIITYLFGAPRCGNEGFVGALDQQIPHFWALANRSDTIPFLPPTACSYYNGTYIYADYTNTLYLEIETGSLIDNHAISTYICGLGSSDDSAICPRNVVWNRSMKRLVDFKR